MLTTTGMAGVIGATYLATGRVLTNHAPWSAKPRAKPPDPTHITLAIGDPPTDEDARRK